METRVAVMGIIVEKGEAVELLNSILHEYGEYIVGRMGIPYRKTRHIAPFNSSRTCTNTNGADGICRNMGKQPAGKLRQALSMMKYRIRLAKP